MVEIERLAGRVLDGGEPTRSEALSLAGLPPADLPQLLQAAWRIRRAFHGDALTVCSNVFIPVTRSCRNECGYCSFRQMSGVLTPEQVLTAARQGDQAGCREALIVTGEQPETVSDRVRGELAAQGHLTLAAYVADLCARLVRESRLLPHVNIGITSEEELLRLKPVTASLGLMLESISVRLGDPGGPHALSPGKAPDARLRVLESAGRHGIVFTTGILVGIGESPRERVEALLAIGALHRTYGHIQEVIVQNFRPGHGTPMAAHPSPELVDLLHTVALARLVLPPEISVQVPPNLNPESFSLLLLAGANDAGGISSLTVDEVNPGYRWPPLERLAAVAGRLGLRVRERLPVHPGFVRREDLGTRAMRERMLALVDEEGYARPWDRGEGGNSSA